MAGITLSQINKRWGSVVGVKDFNLEIDDKEFIVLLGPSGCGKTTTMRMIAGLETPTEGDIIVDGQRINELEPKDRDVAMVFQNYGLYPTMTVKENIRFQILPSDILEKGIIFLVRIRISSVQVLIFYRQIVQILFVMEHQHVI